MGEVAEQAAPAEAAPSPGAEAAPAEGTEEQAAAENPQKRGESDKDYEIRLSQRTREARMARAEAEKYKGVASKYEGEVTQLRAELEKAKTRKGLTRQQYVQVTRAINAADGDDTKISALFDEDELDSLPKAFRDKIEALEKDQKERQEREANQNQQRNYESEISTVKKALAEMAEECPLYAGFKDAADYVRNNWYAEWKQRGGTKADRPDLQELIAELHKPLADRIADAIESEQTRSFLLRARPELKARFGGQEVGTGGPQSEHQGAARGNGSPAKASPPAVSRKPEPKQKLERYEADEARIQASHDAYNAYRLAVRSGKA